MKKIWTYFKEDELDGFEWLLPHQSIELFMKKRIRYFMIVFIINLTLLSFTIYKQLLPLTVKTQFTLRIAINVLVSYMFFKYPFWKIKKIFNVKREDIYRVFPLWISTLEVLIMTNNIPNTFKKSIATAPAPLQKDLIDFCKKIEVSPENKEYYREFLSQYQLEDVSEIIMDMYAFNHLEKNEIVYEFRNLNRRLNKIAARIRQERQRRELFVVAALNSFPLLAASIYVLVISMMMNIA